MRSPARASFHQALAARETTPACERFYPRARDPRRVSACPSTAAGRAERCQRIADRRSRCRASSSAGIRFVPPSTSQYEQGRSATDEGVSIQSLVCRSVVTARRSAFRLELVTNATGIGWSAVLEDFENGPGADRLHEVQEKASLPGTLLVLILRIRGNGDEARGRRDRMLLQRFCEAVSVGVRQPDVAQDHMRLLARGGLEAL